MRFGYFLSSEEHRPQELVRQAERAEQAGFRGLWISDHYHPWIGEQGQSPFVWSVIGALSRVTSLPITTAVTCPLVRTHPAIIAQAAATSAVMTDGGFRLGVGTGEALNEHIIESRWPPVSERLEMLEEAVEVIRDLWTGEFVNHRGEHYDVDNARIYTLPDTPPPIYMSAFGEKALDVAIRIADGFISTRPNGELVARFKEEAGQDRPAQGGLKVCYADDETKARETVHRLWPTQGIKGEASQILPSPVHFEQLAQMVTVEQASAGTPCGPDPEPFLAAIRQYEDAGFDELYISQIGPEQDAFFDFFADRLLPQVA